MTHRDVVPALDLDSDRTISPIRKRIGWVVACDIHVAKLVRNLASESRHVTDSLGIVDRAAACLGNIRHEVSAMPAAAAAAAA